MPFQQRDSRSNSMTPAFFMALNKNCKHSGCAISQRTTSLRVIENDGSRPSQCEQGGISLATFIAGESGL
jgi:hypothetical protein